MKLQATFSLICRLFFMRIFKTFHSKHALLQKYISYYYIDIADDAGYVNEYICYPHFNCTISLYKSHVCDFRAGHNVITYGVQAAPLQIFTPLREEILKVSQYGPVHKVAIVFNPLGIQQFFKQLPVTKIPALTTLFTVEEMMPLWDTMEEDRIVQFLDASLLKRFEALELPYMEKAIAIFHADTGDCSVEYLAEHQLGISRKQLNRQFQKYMGTSAQKYRSIVRFRQLMEHKLNPKVPQNLTALSHQLHYTDQSHFIKSCRQLTGLSPGQFFREGKLIGSADTFWNFSGK